MRSAAEAARRLPAPLALAGGAAGLAILALNLGALGAVWARAEGLGRLGPADWAAVRFTLLQAGLSALLSVALAVPVARALARRAFPGRRLLILLMGAPFVLPSLVAVAAILAVFGRAGLVNQGLAVLGLPPVSPYGLQGVVMAHVFFNLPLAVRLILQGWARVPAEHLRLAEALGLPGSARFRLIEAPMLARILPGALAVVFLICLTSFAVALVLGGGPRATTLELAIWQAFRFDFDLGRAAALGLVQTGLGLAALALVAAVWRPGPALGGLDRVPPAGPRGLARGLDALWIGAAAGFLVVPLAMVVVAGAPHLPGLPAPVWAAAGRSLVVAGLTVAMLAALGAALVLAAVLAPRGGRLFEAAGIAGLAASPLVIGTGLFIWIRPLADPAAVALPVVAAVNAAMALPFLIRAALPAAQAALADHGRLAAALGLSASGLVRHVLWPRVRRPAGYGLALGAALAAGDLGAIALFAPGAQGETLPLALARLMGAYRTAEAAGAALLLMALALAVFALVERLVGGRDAGA
jgi:thiamine transport system permease protein